MKKLTLFQICSSTNISEKEREKLLSIEIEEGADINAQDKNGVSPLMFAVRFRHPPVVQELIRAGADVNHRCKRNGSTALHRAVTNTGAPGTKGKKKESKEIVKILLDNGANPKLKNSSKKTVLDYTRDSEIIEMLKTKL